MCSVCHQQIFAAIAAGGVHLRHLDLANRGSVVNDKALQHFWTHPDDSRPVPCPELEYFSVFDCEVSVPAVAKVFLCHPKLTYLGFKRIGTLLEGVEEEMLKRGVTGFKCLLTHVCNTGSKRDVITMGPRYIYSSLCNNPPLSGCEMQFLIFVQQLNRHSFFPSRSFISF